LIDSVCTESGKNKKGKRNNQNCYKSIPMRRYAEVNTWKRWRTPLCCYMTTPVLTPSAHSDQKQTRDKSAREENIGYYGGVRACKTPNKDDSEKSKGSNKTAKSQDNSQKVQPIIQEG
jgi:hypothetical protein